MSDLPSKQSDFLAFCTAHAGLWGSSAALIGVLPGSALAFKNHSDAAKLTLDAAEAAKVAAKAATNNNDTAMKIARSEAADIIKTIRAFAQATNNPNVYSLAGIAPPTAPSPTPAPSKPEMLGIALQPSGALTLSWRATNRRGGIVTYAIGRKLPGDASFTILANTGGNAGANGRPTGRRGLRKWTDSTLPVNSGGVQYIITGMRGNISGESSEILTVTFGAGRGGGMAVASSTTMASAPGVGSGGIKMAA